jgi:ketosteroid isomerase-like protein
MSQEKADLVRSLMQAWKEGDFRAAERLFDEWIVFDPRGMEAGFGEFSRVYVGPEEVRQCWREWLAAWREIWADPVWIYQVGDRVVTWVHQRQVGKDSGLPIEVEYAWDYLFRGEKIVRIGFFRHEDEALEAVGLREEDLKPAE